MCNLFIISSIINKNMKSILYILVTSSLLFFSAAYSSPISKHYGPVKGGETLWYIAYKYKPTGVTRWKMMRAIHRHNRASFKNGNINLLQKGSMLILPRSKMEVTQFIRGTVSPAIATEAQTDLKKANAELKTLREELSQSRSVLDALRKESKQLTKSERSEYKKNMDSLQQKYSRSQQKIIALEQENVAIRQNKQGINAETDNALARKVAELEKAHDEVALLKKQNDLLKEQAVTGDSRAKNTEEKDRVVSETIAALNSDIGQLRFRIKELEDLEKLKDAHIVELKKTLKHATRVIKDQDLLNKKMHAQLESMNAANPLAGQQQAAFLAPKENKQAGVAPPLSDMMKSVSPKFWLLLTLGGLLLVLTFLWRSLSQRNLAYTEDEKGRVFENDHRR